MGTTFTPSPQRPGVFLGQSNLPQTIMMDNEASFRKWVPACPDDWFSWQFFGRIAITTAGAYTFAIESDDGSLLYLNLVPAPTMGAQSTAASPPSLAPTTTDGAGVTPQQGVYSLVIDNDGLHGARKYTRVLNLQPGLYNAKVSCLLAINSQNGTCARHQKNHQYVFASFSLYVPSLWLSSLTTGDGF